MFTKLAKLVIPKPRRRKIVQDIRETVKEELRESRRKVVGSLPKVHLNMEHVSDCRLIPNRRDLLSMIPKGAIIAELGVNEGDFSSEILDACEPRQLHLVDIWGSERYHNGLYEQVRNRFDKQIAAGVVSIHRMLSTDAANLFTEHFFDFVYIDTAHSYSTTRDELNAYASKIKLNGILAGHDYLMGNWVTGYRYGVIEAVHEFAINENWKLAALTANYPESPSFALQRLGSIGQS